MYPIYRDIRDRLGEPLWHDEHGVPRYAEFHPKLLGIYDDWAVLFNVECQGCGRQFPCAVGRSAINLVVQNSLEFADKDDAQKVLYQMLSWGDAPWHDGDRQCAGTTMSTDITAILQVWRRVDMDWVQIDLALSIVNKLLEVA